MEAVKTFWERHWIFRFIVGFTSVIGILVTLKTGYDLVYTFYSGSIGMKPAEYRLVQSLEVGVNIDVYRNKLGVPFFAARDKQTGNKNYFFSKKYFVCQIVTNADGEILLYGVTPRYESFNPTIEPIWPEFSPEDESVTLGVTKFSRLTWPPQDVFTLDGSKTSKYQEVHYYGFPGEYKFYLFGWTNVFTYHDVLFGDVAMLDVFSKDVAVRKPADFNTLDATSLRKLQRFRKTATINTVAVTRDGSPVSEIEKHLGFQIGPSREGMWLEPKGVSEVR